MEPIGSLPHSQAPATCPYPEPARPNPCPPPSHFPKIRLNIILQPTPGYSKWSLSLRFLHPESCIRLSSPQYMLHVPPISFYKWGHYVRIKGVKQVIH